jgi:Type II secretion system (T2SS), protein G
MTRPIFRFNVLVLSLVLSANCAYADLSKKEARKLIRTMSGVSLPGDSVRVETINMTSSTMAEVTARIEMVFRLTQTQQGKWRLNEIRIGEGRWELLEVIAQAAKLELPTVVCDSPSQFARSIPSELTFKRVRCLVAALFGVNLPSDEVRVKQISSLGLPLGSEPSALAVAFVQLQFRVSKEGGGGWQVVELRSGNRAWTSFAQIPTAIDEVKRSAAAAELSAIAKALDAFRRDRGSFVVSDKQSVLIDHLSPQYLAHVTRIDPWHRPYHYQGERDRFTLRSVGSDGKPNTADDVIVTSSTP